MRHVLPAHALEHWRAECQRYEEVAFIYSIAGCDFARIFLVASTIHTIAARCFKCWGLKTHLCNASAFCFRGIALGHGYTFKCPRMSPNGVKWFQMCPNVSKPLQMSAICGTCLQIFSNVSKCLISGDAYNKLTFLRWHIFNVTLCVWGLFSLRIIENLNVTSSVLVPFWLLFGTK